MIWQQDGAPPHYGQAVREYLDDTFDQWIRRRGSLNGHRDLQILLLVISHYGK